LRDNAASPSWSPDAEKIAYKATGGGGNPGSGINIVNADGSGATFLTSGNYPAWSPDGQKVAFADGASDIYVINADGTGKAALTATSEFELRPDWQPLPFKNGANQCKAEGKQGRDMGMCVSGR
jgi:Tol biopolymer transport system component